MITTYQGAGPSEIESMVTKPLEKTLSTVPNMKNITSSSFEEVSGVGVEMETGVDIEKAANNIREKIDLIKATLPDGAENPIVVKFDPSMIPVVVMSISSTKMGLKELRAYAADEIGPKLERIEGIAAASVYGGRDREIQVRINRSALAARHISIDQIKMALGTSNLNLPGGRLNTPQADFLVRTTAQFNTVNEIGNLAVGQNPETGAQIFLREVANIEDSYAEMNSSLPVNGKEGVILQVQKTPGANTVKVASKVRAAIQDIKATLPPGTKVSVIMDLSTYIQDSINNVFKSIVEGGLLAILIIMFFLASYRSTSIISVAIPFSVIATFSMMYFGNMTLNIATMGGLALGVGRLVDDSIVVLENIYRHLKMGKTPYQASLDGASEVGMAVIASTITTIIVFVPILFVQGLAGVIFKPMAYTVSFSLFASLMVSLMLLPVLTNRFLKIEEFKPNSFMGRLNKFTTNWQTTLDNFYHNTLRWALHHKTLVIVFVGALFLSTVIPLIFIGKEFIPNSDAGEIDITLKLPVGTKLEETVAAVDQIYQVFKTEVPEMEEFYSRVGVEGRGMAAVSSMFTGITGPNAATIGVTLVKVSKRERSTDEIIELVRSKISKIPDAEIHMASTSMMSNFGGGSAPILVEIYGHDLATAKRLSKEINDLIAATPHTVDVQTSLTIGSPELQVKIDAEKAAALGLSISQVANTINTEIGGTTASIYRDPNLGKEFNILVQFDQSERRSINDLERVVITTPTGSQVPLNNIATIIKSTGPVKIERKNQERLVTVSAQTLGAAPGTVAEEVQRRIERQIVFPTGFSYKMGGSLKEQQESFASLLMALVLAILLVYMVLASQFESLVDPFIIMFAVPLGLVGVIWGLFLSGSTLSVVSFLGIIMMSGIVVSNGILLVDYTNQLRKRGMELYEAVAEAGRTRLRPVLMTTLTTIIGLLPMAIGLGEGAEVQSPMAVSVVSGLSFLDCHDLSLHSDTLCGGRDLSPPASQTKSRDDCKQLKP